MMSILSKKRTVPIVTHDWKVWNRLPETLLVHYGRLRGDSQQPQHEWFGAVWVRPRRSGRRFDVVIRNITLEFLGKRVWTRSIKVTTVWWDQPPC